VPFGPQGLAQRLQPEWRMPLWNDARFALRQLRKSPAFTLVVLATLGLSIGANTAIYSELDAVLLRPAPYPELDRLALVTLRPSRTGEGEATNYGVIARVKPGFSWAAAADELKALSPGIAEEAHVSRDSTIEQRMVPFQSGSTKVATPA